jgi:hypothetical protein
MTTQEIEQMWIEFSDIPINNNDEIEKDFYWWNKGVCRFDIWRWFDEKYSNGVVELNIKSQWHTR